MDDLKKLLLSMPKIEMEEVPKKYKDKEPEPLNTMFQRKADANSSYMKRKLKEVALYPEGD